MAINVDRYQAHSQTLIGKLTPFWLRGKRVIRLLTALAHPIDSVNESFREWAKDTLVDAVTTSQIIVLKWSLKYKLGKYFEDPNDEFVFDTYGRTDYTTIYQNQAEQYLHSEATQLWAPEDQNDTAIPSDAEQIIIRNKEEIVGESTDLTIYAPKTDGSISDERYEKLIRQNIDPYLAYDMEYDVIIKS